MHVDNTGYGSTFSEESDVDSSRFSPPDKPRFKPEATEISSAQIQPPALYDPNDPPLIVIVVVSCLFGFVLFARSLWGLFLFVMFALVS